MTQISSDDCIKTDIYFQKKKSKEKNNLCKSKDNTESKTQIETFQKTLSEMYFLWYDW